MVTSILDYIPLDKLQPREREIFECFFGVDGETCTIEDITNRFGITTEGLRQIIVKSVVRILKDYDPLTEDAIRYAVEINMLNTDLLQRKFSIGYVRASKIMNSLEGLGVVSAVDKLKNHKVLIDSSEIESILKLW